MTPRTTIGRVAGRGFWLALIGSLGYLTYVNATTSRALVEAVELEARGDYPSALRSSTEHLLRRPWSRQAAGVAARCLSRLDFAEAAEPYYRRAGPLSVADLRYRAYGLTRATLRSRALEVFDEVLARQPDDLASLRLKAGLLISMELWEALGTLGRTLSADPRGSATFDAPVAVGGHWTFKPREVASVATLGATLQGIASHNFGEFEDAARAYDRVLALDPEFRSMPLDRRLFWTQFGEDLLAIGRAADLVRLAGVEDPTRSQPGLVALVARALTQLGAMAEAESCWRRLQQIDPSRASSWLNLGRIEQARGNAEEAVRLLTRAARLAPDSVDAVYNLGLLCRRLGRPEEARKWEEQAARLRQRPEEKAPGPGLVPGPGPTPPPSTPAPGARS